MRIIAVSIMSLLTVACMLTMTRIWGLGQNFNTFEHVFLTGEQPFIIVKVSTLAEAEAVLKQKPDAILWIDVRFSRDQIAFILPKAKDNEFLTHKAEMQKANPSVPIFTGARVPEYSWEDINEFYKSTPALKEFYLQFPKTRLILNIVDNVSEVHHLVVKALENLDADKRTFIQSDALLILRTIKDLKPEWVYGTSQPDLMRLLTFDSIYITPSIQFMGDVFVAPFTLMNRPAFNDSIIEEMRRRHKRIILGPIHTIEELQQARRLKAEGYITDNLEELTKLLNQGPAQ